MKSRSVMRLVPAQPTTAEVYCSAWVRMNEGMSFAIRANEVHYLKAMALSMDDDLASLLLLKKLKLANHVEQADSNPATVGMNSWIEFRFGSGHRQFRQLLHPSVCQGAYALSIGSRLGAGLIGLRAGQVLLWPDEHGCPRELRVMGVRRHSPANDGGDPPPLAG